MKSHLTPHGFYAMNLVAPAGASTSSDLLTSVVATLRTVFADVHVYLVSGFSLTEVQNIILVAFAETGREPIATAHEDPILRIIRSTRANADLFFDRYAQVLTDDHSPVEWLVAKSF